MRISIKLALIFSGRVDSYGKKSRPTTFVANKAIKIHLSNTALEKELTEAPEEIYI